MRITLIDDSIPFDGSTPRKRSIGGAEKAFVGLSEAFAAKGYEVTAVNRCESYFELNGVRWLPFDAPRPPDCEILIAFRRPTLLQEIDDVDQRFLWLWGPLSFLNKAKNQVLLDRYMPTLIYLGETQRRSWKPNRIYQEAIIVPGVVDAYLDFESDQSEPPPVAITTTHPAMQCRKYFVFGWMKFAPIMITHNFIFTQPHCHVGGTPVRLGMILMILSLWC